jgi:hypothetical protein
MRKPPMGENGARLRKKPRAARAFTKRLRGGVGAPNNIAETARS